VDGLSSTGFSAMYLMTLMYATMSVMYSVMYSAKVDAIFSDGTFDATSAVRSSP